MSENCSHDCSNCSKNCSERESFIEKTNEFSDIKKVIGIVSGKGGVGKSFVTSLLAANTQKKGKRAAILDADITGPSIPKMFGMKGEVTNEGNLMVPLESDSGTKVMSVNFLLKNETDPVIWRGPIIAGVVRQFWTDVIWDEIDCMYVDMPPGTGDVPLTVFQTVQVDGAVVVTSPQDLVSLIVKKSYNMAVKMNINIIGFVENFSYLTCPDCGKKIEVFGKSNVEENVTALGLKLLSQLPINQEYVKAADEGRYDEVENEYLKDTIEAIENV